MEPLVLTGKYTSCKVFTQDVDQATMSRIFSFLNCPVFEGCSIRVMPDCHEGKGACIGFTAPMGECVIPNVIGVDLGCAIVTVNLQRPEDKTLPNDFRATFDQWLRENVPFGFGHRTSQYPDVRKVFIKMMGHEALWDEFVSEVERIAPIVEQTPEGVFNQIGTMGGNNHFLEIERDLEGCLWLTVHSGSRNFGLRVAEYHQTKAQEQRGGGRRNELAWLEGDDAQQYLKDARVAQKFATLNRLVMLDVLLQNVGGRIWERKDSIITSVHNYIGDDGVIRKGAISAHKDEKVIIPWNMRDGLIVGRGLGNPDWNNSAPHGAGRLMSRGEAKRTLSVHAYEQTMKDAGVWSSCVSESTLDECPQCYKAAADIEACIADTVEVTNRLKPIYNFKASEDPDKRRQKQERKFKREREAKLEAEIRGIDGRIDMEID